MSSIRLEEGNLSFGFSGYLTAVKFDDQNTNPHGLEPVDFVAESDDCIYFIEVKDYQHPHPMAVARRDADRLMLLSTASKKSNDESLYCHKIGSKFKDSLLRKYVMGDIDKKFDKVIVYLFFINFDALGAMERGMLKERISNHVPKGLKDSRRGLLPDISFDLVSMEQLKQYGIVCTART